MWTTSKQFKNTRLAGKLKQSSQSETHDWKDHYPTNSVDSVQQNCDIH